MGNIAFKRVPNADVVGDENRVEPGFLRRARQLLKVSKVKYFASRSSRMAPGNPMIALRIKEERTEDHSFHV
jgi:hypothetical protein